MKHRKLIQLTVDRQTSTSCTNPPENNSPGFSIWPVFSSACKTASKREVHGSCRNPDFTLCFPTLGHRIKNEEKTTARDLYEEQGQLTLIDRTIRLLKSTSKSWRITRSLWWNFTLRRFVERLSITYEFENEDDRFLYGFYSSIATIFSFLIFTCISSRTYCLCLHSI